VNVPLFTPYSANGILLWFLIIFTPYHTHSTIDPPSLFHPLPIPLTCYCTHLLLRSLPITITQLSHSLPIILPPYLTHSLSYSLYYRSSIPIPLTSYPTHLLFYSLPITYTLLSIPTPYHPPSLSYSLSSRSSVEKGPDGKKK